MGTLNINEKEKLDSDLKIEVYGKKNSSANGISHPTANDDAKTITQDVDTKSKHENHGRIRHMIALLALSSIVLANANRQAFNQALVSMTFDDNVPSGTTTELLTIETTITSQTIAEDLATEKYVTESNQIIIEDKFHWSPAQIGLLQAAFSYGYTPFMIVGGRLSEIYGAKWVVFLSGFGSAVCMILSPMFADWNFTLLVAARVLMGLAQTGVSPALYALLSRWLPADESSIYVPMIKVAVQLGFMSGAIISGFFTWRASFYIVGLIGMIWSLIWLICVSSNPDEHKFLSKKELTFIKREIQRQNNISKTSEGDKQNKKPESKSAPWLSIITNPVVLAFMLGKFTVKFSTDMQGIQVPMYLGKVFKVSKELNGSISALNFAIQGIFTGPVAYVAKEFVVRKTFGLSKTGVRRLFQGICNFGMALSYVMITLNMGSLQFACGAVVMLSIFSMFGSGGETLTPMDLSLEFAASIMAIANSSANLSGIVLPPLVSFLLGSDLSNGTRWNLVLLVVAAIISLGGLAYCTIVTAEVQDFSAKQNDRREKEVSKEANIELEPKDSTCIDISTKI